MKTKLVMLAALVLAFLAGVFFGPKKTEIKEVEKIVYKERTDTKTNSSRTVVKKEVKRPDGTVETEITTKIDRQTDKKTDKSLDQDKSKESKTESRPEWRVNVQYYPALVGYQDMSASVALQKRLFSELYLGVSVTTQKHIGLSIGIGF